MRIFAFRITLSAVFARPISRIKVCLFLTRYRQRGEFAGRSAAQKLFGIATVPGFSTSEVIGPEVLGQSFAQ